MADFHDDLNYGVTLGDPVPPVGTGYNPPQSNAMKDSAVSDEQKQAEVNSDKYDLKQAGHAGACIATFAFKGAAIFFYLIVGSVI